MIRTLILGVLICAVAPAVSAQDAGTGAEDFRHFCASCHGIDAAGDGPMAPNLLLKPPNLRRLSALNEGSFPTSRVIARIDGRDPLVSHGSMMPVYGRVLEGKTAVVVTPEGQKITTSRRIAALVAYLRGVQE